ncbi:23S rRNA (pseudouridine(1915)-N(3))-methyltransferase RlmH [Saccharophagus sp. K07]|uniref:23S rRNA (pseudouridine(1915)-N(3))-methyltransferase RlmH n=1 Tax=Saccharophagus sp. K07 TaxID=2283636 RepID=UPI001651C82A|nr:23S rRNA (pseudouridine(1915)-N(3))-methyltransferase RlmH [Saccharophagus sp. K07]MBC6904449.1 23S rRNA (pseudouridine(1915)-N(3))-methyltransferase RlmH [Saccharophagus sp. K07]
MKVQMIAVGTRMPAWVQAGYDEYAKRLPKELTPTLVEIPLGNRGKNGAVQDAMKQEGEAILQHISSATTMVALDVQGKSWSTEQLAEQLSRWRMDGRNLAFVIGGPDGFSQQCLARADVRWSLSNLTLPHPVVRIVLIEQLYRAWTIWQNHPYHK